jgi:hypothetical protein
MKIVCAHCQAEGKPGILGEIEPQDDPTITYSICPEHRLRVEAEAQVATTTPREEEQQEDQPKGRRFDRVPIALPVTGWAPQYIGTALEGKACYVGAGGLMLEFPVEIVKGSFLRVVLQATQGPVEVEGEIVWTTFHDGIVRHGLSFLEPKGPDFVDLVAGEKP